MSAMALYGQLTGRSKAEAIDMRNGSRSGFFGKRKYSEDFVKTGRQFYRTRLDNSIETATVISVSSDGMGIPHVRYKLDIQKLNSSAKFTDGPRSLSLKTFMSTYQAES